MTLIKLKDRSKETIKKIHKRLREKEEEKRWAYLESLPEIWEKD